MKRRFFICMLAMILIFITLPLSAEANLSVSVTPGKHWKTTTWFGVFPMKHTPQFAVWIEDLNGNFVQTLTVTKKAATNTWVSGPENGRPEALPVWKHRSSNSITAIDAESSATPKGTVAVTQSADKLTTGQTYVVFLEVNSSFDYNDTWPKNAKEDSPGYSGVNGQPSVVYSARFIAGKNIEVELSPVGTGAVDGSDGEIRPTLDGLTTALSIIQHATLSF